MLMIRIWHPEVPLYIRRLFVEVGEFAGIYEHRSTLDLAHQDKVLDYYTSQKAEGDFMQSLRESSPMLEQFNPTVTTGIRKEMRKKRKLNK